MLVSVGGSFRVKRERFGGNSRRLAPASAGLLARYQGELGKLAGEALPVAFGSTKLSGRKLQETAAKQATCHE